MRIRFKLLLALCAIVALLFLFSLNEENRSTGVQIFSGEMYSGNALTTDGVMLPYWFYDRGTDYVLVYLHGGPGSNSSAMRNAYGEKLANALGSILFFDQRRGGSREFYTFDHAIDDLNVVINTAVPDKKIVLWGHSFGGTLAVMNAFLGNGVDAAGYILDAPWLNEELCIEGRLNISQEQRAQNIYEREMMLSYKEVASDGTGYVYWLGNERLNDRDFLPYLSHINDPVLVLAGVWDNNVTINQVEAMKPYLKQGSIRLIENAGHNAIFSHEEEFIDALRTFSSHL